jgi:hypothetical protein
MKGFSYPIIVIAAMLAISALAQDKVELEGASIIGNRELPKVLYIVPWHMPGEGGLEEPPVDGLVNETLGPIDRDVFRRQLEYHQMLEQQTARKANP